MYLCCTKTWYDVRIFWKWTFQLFLERSVTNEMIKKAVFVVFIYTLLLCSQRVGTPCSNVKCQNDQFSAMIELNYSDCHVELQKQTCLHIICKVRVCHGEKTTCNALHQLSNLNFTSFEKLGQKLFQNKNIFKYQLCH